MASFCTAALSVKALIGAARERGVDHPLARSTVHRLLSREDMFDKRPGESVAPDRRRFAFRDAGELWMSDVMHGSKVRDARRRLPMGLFVDNGANFRSQQLALVCAKLGIALIHARPYQPAALTPHTPPRASPCGAMCATISSDGAPFLHVPCQ